MRGVRLVILNYNSAPTALARQLAAAEQVYFDFAMLEGIGALRRLMDDVGPKRVLFGRTLRCSISNRRC